MAFGLFYAPPAVEGEFSSYSKYDAIDAAPSLVSTLTTSDLFIVDQTDTKIIWISSQGSPAAAIRIYDIPSKTLGSPITQTAAFGEFAYTSTSAESPNFSALAKYFINARIGSDELLQIYKKGVLLQTFDLSTIETATVAAAALPHNLAQCAISADGKFIVAVHGRIPAPTTLQISILKGS